MSLVRSSQVLCVSRVFCVFLSVSICFLRTPFLLREFHAHVRTTPRARTQTSFFVDPRACVFVEATLYPLVRVRESHLLSAILIAHVCFLMANGLTRVVSFIKSYVCTWCPIFGRKVWSWGGSVERRVPPHRCLRLASVTVVPSKLWTLVMVCAAICLAFLSRTPNP